MNEKRRAWLEKLRAEYAAKLPSQLAGLAALLARAREGATDARQKLEAELHRISGTAGTYGFESLSADARDAEERLRARREAGSAVTAADWARIERKLEAMGRVIHGTPGQ